MHGFDYMTAREVAQLFHISENTVHSSRWKKRSGLTFKKVGRRLFIDREEILRKFDDGSFCLK
jgi:hypothetical protein